MNQALAPLLAAFFFAPALATEPAPSRFHFKIPDGWLDKSPPDARASYTLAFDEADELAFQAKVAPGGEAVTPAFLEKYASESQKAVKRINGAELKVVKKGTFDIGGVTAARFVFETPPPPGSENAQPARQLQFYIPVGAEHALLTFTAPGKSFDKFEPLFDKTARATQIKK